MMLIDYDKAVWAVAVQLAFEADMEYPGEHKPTEYTDVARSWLKGIPTIEAEKRGRWIKASTDGAVFCSECGTEWLSEAARYYNFCPICGAKMEASDD